MNEQPINITAFPVGEYVADELEARGLTASEAVKCLAGDAKVNELWLEIICCVELWHEGNIAFCDDDAQQLETIFGLSSETWMNLDKSFRQAKGTNSESTHKDNHREE